METRGKIEKKSSIKQLLIDYSDKKDLLNKIVVSKFIQANGLNISEGLLTQYLIQDGLDFFPEIRSLEDVITVFEQAIPREERSENGAIYTPRYIRDYIVKETISRVSPSYKGIESLIIADISCGCGAFLYSVADYIHEHSKSNYSEVIHNLYGIDISELSVERTRILLSLAAAIHGESLSNDDFNIICHDSLTFDFFSVDRIKKNGGFDAVVGNPPYVRAKHLTSEMKASMRNWSISRVGNADLYIPFFEVGLCSLNSKGILGYISVNSFFKSVNARALRAYFHANQYDLTIINFGEEKIFKDVLAYTCIVFITKNNSPEISYCKSSSQQIINRESLEYNRIPYVELQDHAGWHLNAQTVLERIHLIENTGNAIGMSYPIKNGIATLANDIYIFKPIKEDSNYYYLKQGDSEYKIEKGICKDIIKPNIIKTEEDIGALAEKVIFPYTSDYSPLSESFFKKHYRNAYNYLLSNKDILFSRDKGKAINYQPWFVFGRRQAISDKGIRLVFPYMTDKPHFVLCTNSDMLVYCGYSIYCDSVEELICLKKILESSVFDYYIRNTSKPYSTGYFSYAKNYIKNFGIPVLTEIQRKTLVDLKDPEDINRYVCSLYGLLID